MYSLNPPTLLERKDDFGISIAVSMSWRASFQNVRACIHGGTKGRPAYGLFWGYFDYSGLLRLIRYWGEGGGGHGSPICIAALNQTPTSRICALYAQPPHSLKLQVQPWVVSKVLTATLSIR